MRSVILQLRGAFKLYGLLIVALTIFNVWILKDERHFGLMVVGEGCVSTAIPANMLEAVEVIAGGK
jgi:hypothetical protein